MVSMTWADERLDTGKALWQTSGISTYQYRYQKVCECHRNKPSDTIVTIDMRTVVGVRYDRDDYFKEIPMPPERHKWFRTIDELRSAFADFGDVSSIKILSDRETGRSRGFGFVEMPNQAEGEAAVAQLNGTDVGGRELRVNEAKPREQR